MRIPIGDFARMTHLSIKALRHYHDVGVLVPVEVDPWSGYRFYRTDQVPVAQVVRRFRDLGMPLEDIKAVLRATDPAARTEVIVAHLDRMQLQPSQIQGTVASLRALLDGPPAPIPVEHRTVPAVLALAITDRVTMADLENWWADAFDELHAAVRAAGVTAGGGTDHSGDDRSSKGGRTTARSPAECAPSEHVPALVGHAVPPAPGVRMGCMTLVRTVRLRFGHLSRAATTHTNLSAVRVDGPALWIAGDETATLERLVADDPDLPTEYADERTFRLADFVDMPGDDADEEADIEGLARTGHFLWAVGSHSLRRKRIKSHHDGAKALKRLARVEGQHNRQILVRLPVTEADGLPTPVPEIVVDGMWHRAAALGRRDDLRELLRDDEHLAPFVPIPGKDNGLDVEGIAVSGERVYLGLRGPVLRGWAFVLELRPYVDPDEPDRLRLRHFPGGLPYRKHVLDLDGLGVRDLCPAGDDLLVLAGPTMDLDGPVRIYRWHGARRVEMPAIVRGDVLTRELELTYGEGDDHAEGMGLIGTPEDKLALIVYDSPATARLTADGAVVADIVQLP